MKKLIAVVMLAGAAGCLTINETEVRRWPIDFSVDKSVLVKSAKPDCGVLRLMQVTVRSPYDGEGLVVLRENGTIAVDPYNEFAAAPASLLKGVVLDALTECGRFAHVVPASSVAAAKLAMEVHVPRLAIDCRESGSARAVCEIRMRLLNGRDIDMMLIGEGEAEVSDGNYNQAFSQAVSAAVARALAKLH